MLGGKRGDQTVSQLWKVGRRGARLQAAGCRDEGRRGEVECNLRVLSTNQITRLIRSTNHCRAFGSRGRGTGCCVKRLHEVLVFCFFFWVFWKKDFNHYKTAVTTYFVLIGISILNALIEGGKNQPAGANRLVFFSLISSYRQNIAWDSDCSA